MNIYYLFKNGKLVTKKECNFLSFTWRNNYEFDFIYCQYYYEHTGYSYWRDSYMDEINEKIIPKQTLNLMKLELMLESD